MRIIHRTKHGELKCVSLADCGLTKSEANRLSRLLDVTKATLLFSKGVMLVEGVTEALLLPILSKRLGKPLDEKAVSVVPVHGVEFATLAKLFGPGKLELPVSIITDGDPATEKMNDDRKRPKGFPSHISVSARVEQLRSIENEFVKVFNSKVTLEYDLAESGLANADVLCDCWESLYESRAPLSFNKDVLKASGNDLATRALAVYQAVCLGSPARSKAELAQVLAERLEAHMDSEYTVREFTIPDYIRKAVEHVTA
jgi:putative ATP-dependent endonuclease of the OLD family